MFDRFKRGGDGAVSAGAADRDAETTTMRERSAEDEATAGRDVGRREAGFDDAADEPRFTREDETDHDHRRGRTAAAAGGAAAGAGAEHLRERHRERELEGERDAAVADETAVRRRDDVVPERERASGPLVAGETLAAVRERQLARFGGFSWGSDFFGFLCALGLASILAGIATAAGAAFNLFDQATSSGSDAKTIGVGGGIVLLVILAIAWFCGGYVAGRMARFDGVRQGVGVWLWTILVIAVLAIAAAIGGTQYDVFSSLNLPSIPVSGNTLTSAGAITGALTLLVTLLAAVIGGKTGERFHRKVDRVALDSGVAYEA